MAEPPHLAIVGAGLSGLLTAWRCATLNPDLRITLYEAKEHIGGDHTWSFNGSDVPHHLRDWLAPFIEHRWPGYEVRFPKRQRTLAIDYCSGNSHSLREAISPFIASGQITVVTGKTVEPDQMSADAVIDARGYTPRDDEFPGWQKFVGRTIRTASPHGLSRPVIMDATVEQFDGYRFIYLLPFSDTDLLVEDTYFSSSASLSENEIASRIDDYITEKGWSDHKVLRTEKGVLPMMMATDRTDESAQIGLRGGFAVAATGFTFPVALRVADMIASTIQETGIHAVTDAIAQYRQTHIANEAYARCLNRMFFEAAHPEERYKVLQRFYGLRDGLIRRFYRNELSLADKLRILSGKPPVPVSKALYNFGEGAFIQRRRREDS